MPTKLRQWAVSAICVALVAAAGAVAAMTVQPVAIDLTMVGRGVSAPLRVENNSPTPLPVEIRLVETEFLPDGLKASDRVTDDIIAYPSQALIAPGAVQIFRVQYVGDRASERSRHYYAEVSQLPVQLPEGSTSVQILYNFHVMVNVASPLAGKPELTVTSTEIAKDAEGQPVVAFTVANAARNYGYLSGGTLEIRHLDGSGRELMKQALTPNDIQQLIGYGLVGPETSRRFMTPIVLGSADGRIDVALSRTER